MNVVELPNLPTVARLPSVGSPLVGTDPDILFYTNKVAVGGGSLNATEQNAWATFVAGAKADGFWSSLLSLYIPFGDATASVYAQIGSDYTLTGATYARTGSTGGLACATNRRVLAPREPSFATGGLGIYLTGTYTYSAAICAAGALSSGATQQYTIQQATSTTIVGRHGASGAITESASAGFTPGLYSLERTGATDMRLFRAASQLSTTFTTNTTASSPGVNLAFMCRNNNGVFEQYLPAGLYAQAFYISSGMTAAQVTSFNTRLVALLTAVTRNA